MTEELIHPGRCFLGRLGADGLKRCLDLVERLQMTEKLDIAHGPIRSQEVANPVDLTDQRVHADVSGSKPARFRMVSIPSLEDRSDHALEDFRLVQVVPHMAHHEEVTRVGSRTPIEKGTCGKELQELDGTPVAQRHAFRSDLKDESLVRG